MFDSKSLGRFLALTFIAFCCTSGAFGQEDAKPKLKEKIRLYGYVKDLRSVSFADDPDVLITHNFLHNRLNFRAYLSSKWTLGLEARTRVFYGETVRLTPNYGSLVDVDAGLIDASGNWIDSQSLVANTTMDRAWVQFANEKWNVRLGRQRINWGINIIWNPNDLFNAYNFVDFDYEERPGSDALRVQYFTGPMSQVEVAIKPGKDKDDWVGAGMYKFNKWNYDFQVLSGWYYQDLALGMGWAGNIKNWGFKGEATWFHPQDNMFDTSGVVNVSTGLDYIFKSQLYFMGGLLFNSSGASETSSNPTNIFVIPISAKNLMPAKLSAVATVSYPVTPLISTSLSAVYAPGVNAIFAMPSATYSIAKNWDLSLHGQSFWLGTDDGIKTLGTSVFARLKWSF